MKKRILLIISIFVVVLILFSSSYALLFKSNQTEKQEYTTGMLEITSETLSGSVTLNNPLPMSDSDGENTTPYVFRITNTGNLTYKFNIMLLSTTTDNQISSNYIKLKVNTDTPVKLNSLTDGIILSNITLKPGKSIDVTLRVWLSEDTPNTEIGKTFNAKITTEGESIYVSSDNSGANSPDLVQGLIPVKYDESSSTWVKADSENADGTWYNYDNKLWANAVLVSDTGFDYPITSKNVSISNQTVSGYASSNQNQDSTTSTSTFTITTGSTAGTISFNYVVSSESDYDKLTITVNGTTVANAISGEKSDTYSVSATANTTYTIIVKYVKDSRSASGTDTATIYNLTYPSGSTLSITPDATYPFNETTLSINKMASGFTYDTSTSMYTLKNSTNDTISSSTAGKYVCPDISQTSCSTMYKVTESNTTITKVEEYGVPTVRSDIRSTYTNASEGTEIREDDILAFYVWIPRYKYKVWNISKQAGAESTYAYNAKTEGIDIVFESGKESTGTISCTYNYNVDSANGGVDLSTTTAETCTGNNGDYYTHPAFTFGNDYVNGFWISKFEISSSDPLATDGGGNVTNLTVRSLPNVASWRNNTLSNFNTVIQNMQTSSNIYGLSTSRTNTDSHMLTNFEWGAVAYLTNSKYGRCTNGSCTEVTINNCSSYITGIGADTVSDSESSTTCTTAANKYNGTYGKLASTTGNITGVYDMSGGSWDNVMGNMSSISGNYTFYPVSSRFASSWYTTDTAKYLTTYAYEEYELDTQKSYNRGRLGDATAEVALSTSTGRSGGWYSDSTSFPAYNYAWFNRGGYYPSSSKAGVFHFSLNSGNDGTYYSSRAALVSLVS